MCSSKCLNFFAAAKTHATFLRSVYYTCLNGFINFDTRLWISLGVGFEGNRRRLHAGYRSFISGNPSKMPVECQYKFLTRLIFLFSGSSCYLLTSERDEDNPFKQSNNFYFVFVNERRFNFIQVNSQKSKEI